jgi:uncharacterized repeat protein (TIGR01451 family)
MTRILKTAVLLLAALIAVGALQATPAVAAGSLTLNAPVTDNYKAIWNADPSIQERRTWLALTSVTTGGVTYKPSVVPNTFRFTADQAVTGSDGSTATVTITADPAQVRSQYIRTDSNGSWGPLIELVNPAALKTAPVPVTLSLVRQGVVVASGTAEYRYDATVASAAPGTREYNSPGGRFWIGCVPTRLDWEATAPASTCTSGGATFDLAASISSPANVNVGNSFIYTLGVTNVGAATAQSVKLTDVLPAGVRLQSMSPDPGLVCSGTTTVTCTVASLAAGTKATVRLTVAPIAADAINSSVAVAATGTDANAANNTAARTLTSWGFACTVVGTPGADSLTGTTSRDVLCGLGGNDTLNGGDGNDQFYGGDGNDTLGGGNGNDTLTGGPGDDTIDGGANLDGGADLISYTDGQSSMVVNFGQLHAWDDGAVAGDANVGFDAFGGVEGAVGTAFDDTLLGGAGNDRLEGVGGNDTIYGYGGTDLIDGGVGNDVLYAGSGADTVRGHNGDDRLLGGDGNDLLQGQDGVDALDGQANTDTCTGGGQATDTKVSCEL